MEHEEEFMVDGQGALRLIQEAVEVREAEAAAKKVGYAVRFHKGFGILRHPRCLS
jgi:hypothetical protein